MYKILLNYSDQNEWLGIGIYRKDEKRYLVLGKPCRKYKTFDQAKAAIVEIKNGNFSNNDFIAYEIIGD